MDSLLSWLQLFDASFRLATPLLFAALAGLLSERSGIIDIGLEGKMLFSAFAGAAMATISGSPWQGLMVAVLAGMLFSLLHAFVCITHKGDQVVSGIAINMLALALSSILAQRLFSLGGMTPILSSEQRLPSLNLPSLIDKDDSWISLLYWKLLSGHNILVYVGFALVIALWLFFKFSPLGKRLYAAGQDPLALARAGVSVAATRYMALIAGGAICGLSGAYLSIGHGAGFFENMTVGKGFIALAALIFGKWHPIRVFGACLLFGFLEALTIRLQGLAIFGIDSLVPIQLIEILPYVLTLLVLAGFVGHSIAPKALGKS
ncbi:MAG: ABC transporter permease [Psychrobium sp.]|nr:ABC transporter permease [Psychrobium sp.]